VIDQNYSDAFKLEPKDFTTTFQLCDTAILREIGLIHPNCVSLQAELCKLNVCAPGGCLKSYTDTHWSGQMFGSLIVCLPTQFSGGELVVSHQKKQIKYNCSSSSSDPLNSLCWAAYFGDVEKEVFPVTEGYQVTLMYNLYYGVEINRSAIDMMNNPFFRTLQAVLSNPMFMRDGGILAFKTHYSYSFDLEWADLFIEGNFTVDKGQIISKLKKWPIQEFISKSHVDQNRCLDEAGITDHDRKEIFQAVSDLPIYSQLKGADYVIFNSAKFLGLHVCIRSFLTWDKFALTHPDDFKEGGSMEFSCEEEALLRLFGKNLLKYRKEDITWCLQPTSIEKSYEVAEVLVDAIDPYLKMWYKAAVILIGIPNWSESRRQLITLSEGKDKSTSVDIKDNIKACFTTSTCNYK